MRRLKKWSGPVTVIGRHGNVYYIVHQSSLLRVAPQRLIGIYEAEKVLPEMKEKEEGKNDAKENR